MKCVPLAAFLLAAALAPVAPSQAPATYRRALPGYQWQFPRDQGAHPAFANEWWYFTGNLASADGRRRFGFEVTFFRISPAPGAALDHDLYFTHFAISDLSRHTYAFWIRARRGDWSQAGASPTPATLHLWNENWAATFDAAGPRHLQAAWGPMQLDLSLQPGPRMLNGKAGYSQKGAAAGEASYYYSLPHITAHGSVDGVAVSGLAWMDHEFASDQLDPNQQGWDWLGLQLVPPSEMRGEPTIGRLGAEPPSRRGAEPPHGDLMLFNLRQRSGARDPHSAGTWLPSGGKPVALSAASFTMQPVRHWNGYPIAWRVRVPPLGLDFTVSAALDSQLLHDPAMGVSYWEGAVTVAGVPGGPLAAGVGYLELTGYGRPFTLLQSPAGH